MISKPKRPDATRLTSGVLIVAASAFTVGVGLASPASAAATAISASPAQSTYKAGSTATINVTTTGTPSHLSYAVIGGPDASPSPTTGQPCTSNTVCSVPNSGTPGTDQIRVFDDLDNSGTFNSGEPYALTNVTFSGAPASVGLSTTGTSVSVQNCKSYTVTAKDSAGNPSVGYDIDITATQNAAGGATPLSFCSPAGGSSTNPGTVDTASETVTTGSAGTVTIGIESTTAGTVNVKAASADNPAVAATSSFTVTGGNTGADAVKSLSVSPSSRTAATGDTVSFTVTAKDTAGDPVGGAPVNYQITDGPDKTASGSYPSCGTTSQDTGQVTCTVSTNSPTSGAGTDNFVFFVNQDLQSVQTPGPDSGEPQTTASATFTRQPNYDLITLTCQDPSNGNAVSSTCQVPVGTASTTFTATVDETNNSNVEAPVSGAVVNFTAPSGVHLSSTSGTTGANGTVTVTATPATTTDGTSYTIDATVGNGGTYNGNGQASTSATVTYVQAAAQAPVLSPSVQTKTKGGSATVTATVDDQYGNPVKGDSVAFSITGRNNSQKQNILTDASGKAVFTYNDNPADATQNSDSVDATDSTSGLADQSSATVYWINGSTAPAKVVVSLNGCATTNPTVSDEMRVSDAYYADEACATVENSAGETLAGQSVTFSVDRGFIGSSSTSGTDAAKAGKTQLTSSTNDVGQALAEVGSTKSGVQTITATAGSATGTASVTYDADQTASVTLTPSTASVNAGTLQKFTFKAVDQFGNAVSGNTVAFTQNGTGTLNQSTGITGADGTTSVNLITSDTDSGSGSVTGQDQDCNGTSSCQATSTYTVSSQPTSLTVSAASGVAAGRSEVVRSTVKNADNTPAANEVVSYAVTGANRVNGTATTDSTGTATFTYVPTHAGTDTITATLGNLTQSTTASIAMVSGAVVLHFSPSPVKKGSTTSAVVSVSKVSGAPATGAITLYRVSGSQLIKIRSRGLVNGTATIPYRPTAAGSFVYEAVYSGDSTYQGRRSKKTGLKVTR